ncbi:MAG: MFS transporter [Sandaracinaceae bacterium]|nr:MFS transporter [Sandaracinaceae bacterium]
MQPVRVGRGGSFTPYQWRLLAFLSVATFFEGYDFLALSQLLPHLREYWDLPIEAPGRIVAFVNIGTVLSLFVVRLADRIGRIRVLTLTIAGYTFFTLISGFAPNIYLFVAAQLIARIFLLAEWATSMIIAAEEFPPEKRGLVLGIVQGASALGSIACAITVPLLVTTDLGWRLVYFIAAFPLVIIAYARRNLRETSRFASGPRASESLFAIWKTPYKKRIFLVAGIWFISYAASQNALAFWKIFAMEERGFSDGDVGKAIALASGLAVPLAFMVGPLIDILGRKLGAVIVYSLSAAGLYLCFTLETKQALTFALVLGIFCATAFLPIANAYTNELFPTEYRGAAFAWCNNILGRISYFGAPLIIGELAARTGGYGGVISQTAILPLVAILYILVFLPETRGKELEETSAIP